ncbi:MAG: hypothetical protein JWN99_2859 [Ilumatobacteraceae bacterium]|nr:hypothetical protein [Ilumatobacteraceae bacterium]
MQYLYDTQQLDLQRYEAYLTERLGAYEDYSTDWIS